ncbi:MAG: phosphatidylserine decarboxylase, partial [Woeseiaceae bacterium]|nr:phosphatidylserine decarboxylase [Woeseiaceae bacterium]
KRGVVENRELGRASRDVSKGDLIGWFNMGSTVIVLLPDDAGEWVSSFRPGTRVRMGEAIGRMTADRS